MDNIHRGSTPWSQQQISCITPGGKSYLLIYNSCLYKIRSFSHIQLQKLSHELGKINFLSVCLLHPLNLPHSHSNTNAPNVSCVRDDTCYGYSGVRYVLTDRPERGRTGHLDALEYNTACLKFAQFFLCQGTNSCLSIPPALQQKLVN